MIKKVLNISLTAFFIVITHTSEAKKIHGNLTPEFQLAIHGGVKKINTLLYKEVACQGPELAHICLAIEPSLIPLEGVYDTGLSLLIVLNEKRFQSSPWKTFATLDSTSLLHAGVLFTVATEKFYQAVMRQRHKQIGILVVKEEQALLRPIAILNWHKLGLSLFMESEAQQWKETLKPFMTMWQPPRVFKSPYIFISVVPKE
jgi:hypothetical protein